MPYSAPDALNDCNGLAVSDGVIIPTHELLENGGSPSEFSFSCFVLPIVWGWGVVR